MAKCNITEPKTANNKIGFAKIPTFNNELSSDIAFNALNISIITNTVKDKVLA